MSIKVSLIGLVLIALSCRSVGARTPAGAESLTAAGVVAKLRDAGLRVTSAERLSQPFFSVPAQIYEVDGEGIQLFEYRDAAAATSDAAKVSPSGGSIGTTMMAWVDAPHFFRRDRVIVLYLGTNSRLLAALQQILGPQFAGR